MAPYSSDRALSQEEYNGFGRLGLQLIVSFFVTLIVGISFVAWFVGSVVSLLRGLAF